LTPLGASETKGEEEDFFDGRFNNPCSFLIVGSSKCGKTSWSLKLLRNIEILFKNPNCKRHVVVFFHTWQKKFEDFARLGIVHKWINEFPTKKMFRDEFEQHRSTGSVCLIDDFMNHLSPQSIDIFSVYTHHYNVVTLFISQCLFPDSAAYRQISRQVSYNVIFKTTRDFQGFRTFAQQLYPRNSRFLEAVYANETKPQFSYLLIDHCHSTPSQLQIRQNVLPGEGEDGVMIAYTPDK
jgi:hypothetical protein